MIKVGSYVRYYDKRFNKCVLGEVTYISKAKVHSPERDTVIIGDLDPYFINSRGEGCLAISHGGRCKDMHEVSKEYLDRMRGLEGFIFIDNLNK